MKDILKLVMDENYDELILYLESKKGSLGLNNYEVYILMIAKTLKEVIDTRCVPAIKSKKSNNLYEALMNNDFELARKMNIRFLLKKDIDSGSDIISILLTKLTDAILVIDYSSLTDEYLGYTGNEDLDNLIAQAEEYVDYIIENNGELNSELKKMGLLEEMQLLIKLIFAKRCYINFDFLQGDSLFDEVQKNLNKNGNVLLCMDVVIRFRNMYSSLKGTFNKK